MKRLFLALILIVSLLGIVRAEENVTISNETQAIYDAIEKHSVQIVSLNPEGEFCSGTILSNEKNAKVLTCKHCIIPTEETWADDLKAKTVITSTSDDLAILIMNGIYVNKIPAKIAFYKEPLKKDVYFYGQPGMTIRFPSTGKIIRYTDDWGWAEMPIVPGCSGSGLYNEDKELVGVVWGKMVEGGQGFFNAGGTDIAVFESLYDIRKFLREVEQILK